MPAALPLLTPKYRPDIDGLRAVAVLAVVVYHAFPAWVRGGFVGVDVFFVISGFLISTILFENLEQGRFSFAEFYARRIRRIFPALLVVLAACYAFGWFALLTDEYMQLGLHIAGGAGFVSNIVLWNEVGYFDYSAGTKPLLHLWSLGIEEQFYIVWPLLLWAAHRCRFDLLLLMLIAAVGSFYFAISEVTEGAFYSPLARFWELLVGSTLAWCMLYGRAVRAGLSAHALDGLSLAGGAMLLYGVWKMREAGFPDLRTVVPVLGTALLILAGPGGIINRYVLSLRPLAGLGLISYPLYLWHWPLLSFARIIEGEEPHRQVRLWLVLASFGLAWVTYMLVERPVRRGGRREVLVLVVLMAMMGGAGYHVYVKEGYRFRASVQQLASNTNELIRTPWVDGACLNYVGLKKPLFHYCRFTDAGGAETVAVMGDSHAHVAYPGIARFLKARGINTVMLASSRCPPFLGSPAGNTQRDRDVCTWRTKQLLEALGKHEDITKVFIFTRRPFYTDGTELVSGNKALFYGNNLPLAQYAQAAQSTINRLAKHGREVFYVLENPELRFSAEACLARPLKTKVRDCSMRRAQVMRRQGEYRKAFSHFDHATVIDSLDAFCPGEECIVFDDEGALLYADDDHLSVAGSRFLVQRLLKPFLE